MKTVFTSERIAFVEIDEAFLADYLNMVNDIENVGRLIGRTGVISEEDELRFIRRKLEERAPIFTMVERASGEFIGNIEIMDPDGTEGELGIAITAGKQDKGYGSEAIPAMIEYAKEMMGLGRVFLKVFPDNARAIRVYEKCGFVECGRTEKDVIMELGKE